MSLNRHYLIAIAVALGLLLQPVPAADKKTETKPAAGTGARQKLLDDKSLLFYVPFDMSVEAEKAYHPIAGQEGRLTGDGEYEPGVVDKCISLPGSGLEPGKGQTITYGLTDNLDMKKGTLMLWFKPFWWGTDKEGKHTLMWITMKDPHHYLAWHRSFAPSLPTVLYMIKTNAGMCIDTAEYFKKDRWIHLATTWSEEANEQTVYVNGKRMGSDKWELDSPDERAYLPVSLALGKYYGNDLPINAAYDELYIFGRPLTEEEIAGYYRETMPTPK